MASIALSTDQQAQAISAAAKKYGIPVSVLLGVYGLETNFGQNVATSSAGAVGPFQFLPSTAATYNYPLTNTPTAAQFQQQADAAAHYLSTLFAQTHHSWDAALRSYSGGGYGASAVADKAAHAAIDLVAAISSHGGDSSLSGGLPNVPNPVAGVEAIAGFLTNPTNWLRIGEVIAGIILVAMGLRSLTGNTTGPADVVKAAAKAVK